ncbi:MAG: AEC family transporter [Pseudomonadales bacterium]|mgnify:FL=1|nr:AEC family transporter [Pseudomonadales bacterium]|tara:strand:- start:335 stop:1282 length:948 start_codon:yes stop_codon:yes gene_type:complete
MYLSILADTINVTGPIFILVAIGVVLKRINFVDDRFIQTSSKLVFSLCLPLLLFTTISASDIKETFDVSLLNFSVLASLGTFLASWLVAMIFVTPNRDRGVFIQACFRSNLGVVGLALCANAYGDQGLALASALMASLTVSYNILSVAILSFYAGRETFSLKQVIVDIVKNPLIIAIALAILVSALQVPVPRTLMSAGEYLGSLALPLALLGTGAGMNLRAIRDSSLVTVLAVVMKTALLPIGVTLAAISMGFEGVMLGALFLMFASPTATASFIMVKSMGGNDALAANLIMVTTLVSIFTCSIGLFLLRVYYEN